jgi:uncharacterized membrane protein YkoI
MKQKYNLLAFGILSAAAIGTTYAAISAENDALDVGSAKISLTQAVTAAEQHVGGKAARAEYERHNNRLVFDVEVVKGQTVMDVTVDPSSGKVISASEDQTDQDDEHDKAE